MTNTNITEFNLDFINSKPSVNNFHNRNRSLSLQKNNNLLSSSRQITKPSRELNLNYNKKKNLFKANDTFKSSRTRTTTDSNYIF